MYGSRSRTSPPFVHPSIINLHHHHRRLRPQCIHPIHPTPRRTTNQTPSIPPAHARTPARPRSIRARRRSSRVRRAGRGDNLSVSHAAPFSGSSLRRNPNDHASAGGGGGRGRGGGGRWKPLAGDDMDDDEADAFVATSPRESLDGYAGAGPSSGFAGGRGGGKGGGDDDDYYYGSGGAGAYGGYTYDRYAEYGAGAYPTRQQQPQQQQQRASTSVPPHASYPPQPQPQPQPQVHAEPGHFAEYSYGSSAQPSSPPPHSYGYGQGTGSGSGHPSQQAQPPSALQPGAQPYGSGSGYGYDAYGGQEKSAAAYPPAGGYGR